MDQILQAITAAIGPGPILISMGISILAICYLCYRIISWAQRSITKGRVFLFTFFGSFVFVVLGYCSTTTLMVGWMALFAVVAYFKVKALGWSPRKPANPNAVSAPKA